MNEKENVKSSESQKVCTPEKFKKAIEFIHKNAGGITLITTSAIAVGSVLIRCFSYLIEYGKTIYYNIPQSLIDVSGDNVLYDFFVKGIVALFFILLNLIPYFLWKSEKRIRAKLGWSVLILCSPNIFVVFELVADSLRGINYSVGNIFIPIIAGILVGIVLFFAGFFNGIYEYVHKCRQNKKEQNNLCNTKKISYTVFLLIALIVIESILLIFTGGVNAATQNQFKIIGDGDLTYAVIYENSKKYIITECKIENKQISFTDIDTKREIEKDGVEYTICRLTQKKEKRQ